MNIDEVWAAKLILKLKGLKLRKQAAAGKPSKSVATDTNSSIGASANAMTGGPVYEKLMLKSGIPKSKIYESKGKQKHSLHSRFYSLDDINPKDIRNKVLGSGIPEIQKLR